MRKTYTVSYGPTYWECSIAINHNPETLEAIKNMVEFWTDWEDRFAENDNDYIKTFLQSLAREINYIQVENNYNRNGVIQEFKNREGWCQMDGSWGIEILEVEDFYFMHADYEVVEDPAA